MDECVSHSLPQRPPRGSLEVGQQVGWDRMLLRWLRREFHF